VLSSGTSANSGSSEASTVVIGSSIGGAVVLLALIALIAVIAVRRRKTTPHDFGSMLAQIQLLPGASLCLIVFSC
jgi:hypothetical protein